MTADDGARLAVRTWLPDGVAPLRADAVSDAGPASDELADPPRGDRPRAVIQVVHGMTEHSARYERLATAAVAAGYAVVADDHRGHGLTAPPGGLGHVADRGGWERVLTDLSAVLDAERASWPGAPVVLLGHSWGSFLVRLLAARRGADLALSLIHI